MSQRLESFAIAAELVDSVGQFTFSLLVIAWEPVKLAVELGECSGDLRFLVEESPQFMIGEGAPRPWCWWLGLVPSHESLVPPQHRSRPDDQKRRVPRVLECAAEKGEVCWVGFVEPWASDLRLKNQDLVTKRRDLGISGVAGGENPGDSS